MAHKSHWLTPFLALSLVALPGCGSDDAEGTPAGSCTLVDLGDGTSALRCPDGSELVVSHGKGADGKDGKDGKDGAEGPAGPAGKDVESPCSLTDNGDGTHSITCGETSVILGDSCEQGFPEDVIVTDPEAEPEAALILTLFQATDCTWIRGDLWVYDYLGAELPKALSRVVKVDGDVDIYDNEHLDEVSLPRLTTIGGDLSIADNDALENIDFPALTTIEDDLWIERNQALIDFDGFPALESMGGWLSIVENPSLEQVSNFVALESVGGIQLWTNDSLESIAEFPALEEIAGFGQGPGVGYSLLFIEDHPVLSSVGKLGTVDVIDGNVTFKENPELPQSDVDDLLDGIDVKGSLYICGNKGGDSC